MRTTFAVMMVLVMCVLGGASVPVHADDVKDLFMGSDGAYINLTFPGADLCLQVWDYDKKMLLFPTDSIQGSTGYATFDNIRIGVPRGLLLHGVINPHYEQDKVGRIVPYLAGTPMEIVKVCQDDTPQEVFDKVFDDAIASDHCTKMHGTRPGQAAYCAIDRYPQFVINTDRVPTGGFTVEINVEQKDKPRLKASSRVTFFVSDPVVEKRFLRYDDVTGDEGPPPVPPVLPPTPPVLPSTALPAYTPPTIAPVIGQAALARIAWYRQAAAEKGIKAALVVVLDANGELMYGAKASVLVTKPNGGSYLPVSGMGDGIVAFYDFAGGETVHVYIDGREVLADIYGKPLPATTVAGQEMSFFVRGQ